MHTNLFKAIGIEGQYLPKEAGLPVGGPGSNEYYLLEVHYDNPGFDAGVVDNSGLLIHYTPKLREHDAAIMGIGLEPFYPIMIPPLQRSFLASGTCVSDCSHEVLKLLLHV